MTGSGADYCFECTGSTPVMAEAFMSSRTVGMHVSHVTVWQTIVQRQQVAKITDRRFFFFFFFFFVIA